MKSSPENTILDKAVEMFMRYGLRSVTMDDLAQALSVSKKTIYNHVQNKQQLVERTVQHVFSQLESDIQETLKGNGNAIQKAFDVDNRACQLIENHDPSFKFQLKKYYPEIEAWLEERRRKLVMQRMRENLRQGQKESLFRSDIDVDILVRHYYGMIRLMTDQGEDFFEGMHPRRVMRELLLHRLRGMATERGYQEIDKIQAQEDYDHEKQSNG